MGVVGIYKITNLINNKVYIGQSKNIEQRWAEHKSSKQNIHLHSAFCKYGLENFKFEIIETPEIEELNTRERYWINFYDSTNPNKGYNHTSGGEREPGWVHSEETKQKLSKLGLQRATSPDYTNPATGTKVIHKGDITSRCKADELDEYLSNGWELGFSDKSRDLGAKNRTGKHNGVYQKGYLFAGENNHFYGKHHSPETIQKIRDHMPDTTFAWRGKHHSEMSKKKMRGPRPSISGSNNPNYGKRGQQSIMYGRKCINKEGVELRVPQSEIDKYLIEGWKLGRAIKPFITKNIKED